MLNELLSSMRHYALERTNDVKRGACSAKFAASLFQCYSDSMINALSLIGKETDIQAMKAEAKALYKSIYKDSNFA
ncbi:hypothetical protein ACXJY6_12165 [Vibrio sp. RC27]